MEKGPGGELNQAVARELQHHSHDRGENGDVDHARGELALDPAPHEDELDHFVLAVPRALDDQVHRRIDTGPVELLPLRHAVGDALVLVDGAEVRVKVLFLRRHVLDEGCLGGLAGLLLLGGHGRAVGHHLPDLPAQEPVDVFLSNGDAGGNEHIVPVDKHGLVEHHAVPQLARPNALHFCVPRPLT